MLRGVLFVVLASTFAAPAMADRDRPDADVRLWFPVPPSGDGRPQFFDGRSHHAVPNTVTINRDPYVCDVDQRTFKDQDAFEWHLRQAHGVQPAEIAERTSVVAGIVHYVAP